MSRRATVAIALLALIALVTLAVGANDDPVAEPAGRAAAAPAGGGFRGVAVGMYPWEAERRGFAFPPDLTEIAQLGATHVLLTVPWEQQGVAGVTLRPGPHTVSDRLLEVVIRQAQDAGLGVVLVPVVDVAGGGPHDWRGVIRPSGPGAWWRSYRRFIAHYARLAARRQVSILAIGSELTSMSGDESADEWERVAAEARRVYRGRLAFGVNHDALDRLAPVAFVDVVGVSAYFSLTKDPDASAADLGAAWRRAVVRLRSVAQRTGKPVVLLEVGYPSHDGGAVRPWDYTSGAPVDLEEQRAAYAAAVDALQDASWIDGAFFWIWFGPGGPNDRYYTPRGKPAERELRRYFAAPRASRDAGPPSAFSARLALRRPSASATTCSHRYRALAPSRLGCPRSGLGSRARGAARSPRG